MYEQQIISDWSNNSWADAGAHITLSATQVNLIFTDFTNNFTITDYNVTAAPKPKQL